MRESIVFYKSFLTSIRLLPKKYQLQFYNALFDYGFDGVLPENLPGGSAALFNALKPQVDANNRKYENGKRGGRPKGNQDITKPKPNDNQSITKPKPNEYVNVDVNVNGDGNAPGSQANADGSLSLSEKIISYLNEKAGTRYRPSTATAKLQELLAQGYTEADMRTVIDKKCADWLDDDNMREHLRPSTLFRADKFEEYLNAPVSLKLEKQQKQTDTKEALEKQMAEKREALASIMESIEDLKDEDGRLGDNLQEYRLLKEQAAILEDAIGQIERKLKH